MADKPRMNDDQRVAMYMWLNAGADDDEVNRWAGSFDPPFGPYTGENIRLYRHQAKLFERRYQNDPAAVEGVRRAYVEKQTRIEVLEKLANWMLEDLENGKRWLTTMKFVPELGPIEEEKFNNAEIEQVRGVLDDIAKEVGGRVNKQEISGPDGGPVEFVDVLDTDEGRAARLAALLDAARTRRAGQAPLPGEPSEG